jgi:hypothetical protein
MRLRHKFSAPSWLWPALTGRRARAIGIALAILFLLLSVCARLSIYLASRRMQAVIAELSKLVIDKTTEEELIRTVPYLQRSPWDAQVKGTPETGNVDPGEQRVYRVTFSNEQTWMKYYRFFDAFRICNPHARITLDGYTEGCVLLVPDVLGYRYFSFNAFVTLLNSKVSSLGYQINDRLVFPHQLGAIVSVRSFHSIWRSHQTAFEVDSMADDSPEFRINGGEHGIAVAYAFDAPQESTKHAFQIDLSCFWGFGCRHARQLAPRLWKDKNDIEGATLVRLKSTEPCPARIVAGRVRYLPDAGITIAESEGFRRVPLNVEGGKGTGTVTDFKLIELLRPPRVASLAGVSGRPSVPYPGDYEKQVPNFGPQWAEEGKRILFFSNMNFDSCRMLLASSEALSAARNTSPAPRRTEDQTGFSLQ